MIDFSEYDKVLIGIGDAFNTRLPDNNMKEVDKLRFVSEHVDKDIVEAYKKLFDRINASDYFVVSTCTDDLIYSVCTDRSRIVSPCGGFRYVQCVDDCCHELLEVGPQIIDEGMPVCPHCNKEVVFNRLPLEHYNEGGYLEQWEAYNHWLASTVNKKLLIIELGVGMQYPSVIRFAFEKLAFFNKKSVMYRVHETLAFATEQIKDNCRCVQGNPVEFLSNL